MRVTDVEPMINNYTGSADYGKPFGVILTYSDGHQSRYTDIGIALCANLTLKQRAYVERIRAQIEENHRAKSTAE